MILQALYQCYRQLQEDQDSGVAAPGYSREKVTFAALMTPGGKLLDLIDLRTENEPLKMLVPEHKKRQGKNPSPYFLCDNAKYFFGIAENAEEGKNRFQEFKDLHLKLLQNLEEPEARAVVKYLQEWVPDHWRQYSFLVGNEKDLLRGSNIVFKIDGMKTFVHDNSYIIKVWMDSGVNSNNEVRGQCLITGEESAIARIHTVAIKGVTGAQSSGAALVSFNIDSFESYGKKQSHNAPVSEAAAFAYATALNYLLASDRHRIRFGDTTMVFWAERKTGGPEEDWLALLLDPSLMQGPRLKKEGPGWRIDPITGRQVLDLLKRVRDGLPLSKDMASFDPDVRFYLLGLSPNNSRLAVRFWHTDTFGGLLLRIGEHYNDMSIKGMDEEYQGLLPIWRILRETAVQGKSENIPPLLEGALMRSILTGQAYPQILFTLILARIRSGGDDSYINPIRAGIIKACLKRRTRILGQSQKEGLYTVSLNETSTNTAYRLGRLFALLEKAQQEAVPGANATIRERYFGAASATPGSVFPLLLRLSRHHISKAEYGDLIDRRIQEVMNGLDSFPAHLDLEGQGQFVLGYYHQRQALYQKQEKKEG